MTADPQGNLTAVWQFFDGDNEIVQADGYDAAGPQLRALSIPTGGTAGIPVPFSVSPLDVWSPVASTSWSFGDGQTATDDTVTHTYANPGIYTVRISSADTLSNTTSTTVNITIAARPDTDHARADARYRGPDPRLPGAQTLARRGQASHDRPQAKTGTGRHQLLIHGQRDRAGQLRVHADRLGPRGVRQMPAAHQAQPHASPLQADDHPRDADLHRRRRRAPARLRRSNQDQPAAAGRVHAEDHRRQHHHRG